MGKLSLCMIVKNEEKYLPGCLTSVKNIVDEIIIVDTGSSDNTLNIARSFNADIYHFEWINDFSAARNYALSKTTGDWILYLDADERLSPDSHNELLRIIDNDIKAGFYCNVISFDEHNSKPNVIRYNRLFRKSGEIRFEGKIHEQIVNSLLKNDYKLIESDIDIFHEGYNIPQHKMVEKAERNLKLLLEELNESPTDYLVFQIAQTYGVLGDSEKAIEFFDKIIVSESASPHFKSHAFRYKGAIELQINKNIDKALEYASKAELFFDAEPILNSLLTKIHIIKKNYLTAINYAWKALEINRSKHNAEFRLNLDEMTLLLFAMQAAVEGELTDEFDKLYKEFLRIDNKKDENISNFVNLIYKLNQNIILSDAELKTVKIVMNFSNRNLIYALLDKYDKTDSKSELLEIIPHELRNAWYFYIRGCTYLKTGRQQEAFDDLEIARTNGFNNPALYFYIISILIEKGEYDNISFYINEAEKTFAEDNDILQKFTDLKQKIQPVLK